MLVHQTKRQLISEAMGMPVFDLTSFPVSASR
jgi:hypothetical protein